MKYTVTIFSIKSYEPYTVEPQVKRTFIDIREARKWKTQIMHTNGLTNDLAYKLEANS